MRFMRIRHGNTGRVLTAFSSMLLLGALLSQVPVWAAAGDSDPGLVESPSLTKARTVSEQAQENLKTAKASLYASQVALENANLYLSRAHMEAFTLTKDLSSSQDTVNTLARGMYMSGGAELNTFLITMIPAGESLSSVMSTQMYLQGIADRKISENASIKNDMTAAQRNLSDLRQELLAAKDAVVVAEQQVNLLAPKVTAAQAKYSTLLSAYTPQAGGVPVEVTMCSDPLVQVLYQAGFRGENIREAWAIAMRESSGLAGQREISSTQDYGLFQLNKPTWGTAPWWDDELVLEAQYNANIAFQLSQGGHTWLSWGLDGHGNLNPLVYERSGWSPIMIEQRILIPYLVNYNKFPCLTAITEPVALTPLVGAPPELPAS